MIFSPDEFVGGLRLLPGRPDAASREPEASRVTEYLSDAKM
jgi:hypothetical protein